MGAAECLHQVIMQLKEVIKYINTVKIEGSENLDIKGVVCDSRRVKRNFIFVAIKGTQQDGCNFIKDAIRRGATCIVGDALQGATLQHKNSHKHCKILVEDARKAYAKLCSNFFKKPSYKLKVIGITGTNGKTTTAYLIEAILKKGGYTCGRIGTIDYSLGARTISATNTTPDAGIIQRLLRDMVNSNLNYCIMEVSSHALHQERTDGVRFHSAIFTNLSREHLDYHSNMDEYFLCKKKLFEQLNKKNYAVINIDDVYGKRLLADVGSKVINYGFGKEAKIRVEKEKITIKGSNFLLITPKGKIEIETSLVGRYNIYNILAAISLTLKEGISLDIIKDAISEFNPPPGRLQMVNPGNDFYIYVDYAHTEDALGKVLECLLALKKNRIITVFGCGGDRDKEKRPRMGKVAAKFSDFAIITNDNPRSEEPADIIEQIKKGIPSNYKNYLAVEDRKQAIEKALKMAKRDDIVLIAGKGHETYQIFKDKKIHFNDREIALNYINRRV